MQNIYDTRLNENLLFILPQPEQIPVACSIAPKTVAIAVNLYYEDLVERYMEYLNRVPEEIDVYIISSKTEVFEKVKNLKNRQMHFVEKENRGRDVSALLVAFREIALQYEYICFLHDKKPNYDFLEKEKVSWDRNLWENTISSKAYIHSVLQMFRDRQDIGIMVPPEPIGDFYKAWFDTAWGPNFENTMRLAEELQLQCVMEEEKTPLALGTVFWARKDALIKLFEKQWKYEDFPAEPLAKNGTISHAIERIFGFVAQDAGYKTATIMTAEYAAWNLLFAQDGMKKMYKLMSEQMNLHSLHQISMLSEQERVLREFCEKNEDVYLYGAGVYGVELLGHMAKWGLKPTGFVVSDGKRIKLEVEGYPVKELSEIEKNDKTGIIIAVHYMHQEEMQKILENKGFTNFVNGYM